MNAGKAQILEAAIAELPRVPLASVRPTPLEAMPRLAAHIGSQLQDWQVLLERDRPPWELLLSLALLTLFAYLSRRAANRLARRTKS